MYKIPQQNWETLLLRMEKLTRRAKRLGLPTPTLIKLGEYAEPAISGFYQPYQIFYEVTIDATPVCISGYDFVAKIELDDNEAGLVISRVPGVLPNLDLPANFRKTTNYCSHCKKSVRRNSVYVIRHSQSGEWAQIGRNCLGVFLGGVDPEEVVRNAETLINLDNLCSGAQDSGYFGFNAEYELDLFSTLSFTAFVIKSHGWLSSTKAREINKASTADIVREAYSLSGENKSLFVKELLFEYKQLGEAKRFQFDEQADKAIEWIRSVAEGDRNDYLHSLYVICSRETFSRKHLSRVVSLLMAHDSSLGRKTKQKPSEHVGKVGERQTFQLVVKDIKYWSGAYGTTQAIFFEDSNGNRFIWKSSKEIDIQVDLTYEVTGKIKKHSFYNEIKQTELSYCKIIGVIGGFEP